MKGAGIQTSGMIWGGSPINANTETFDGNGYAGGDFYLDQSGN